MGQSQRLMEQRWHRSSPGHYRLSTQQSWDASLFRRKSQLPANWTLTSFHVPVPAPDWPCQVHSEQGPRTTSFVAFHQDLWERPRLVQISTAQQLGVCTVCVTSGLTTCCQIIWCALPWGTRFPSSSGCLSFFSWGRSRESSLTS